MKTRVAITGAGGFLGRALARSLLADGAEVIALSRRDPALPGVAWQAYDLAEATVPASLLAGVDVVVHAAFAMDGSGPELEQLNRAAAARLREAARAARCHLVFISSMSAHAGAVSSYGRAKWQIEQDLDPHHDAIVRPGLIVGPGGVYARMWDTLRRAPVVPVFFGGTQPVQPIALDDLVTGLGRIVRGRLSGEFNLGVTPPLTLRELYAAMMQAAGRHPWLLPLAGDFTVAMLRAGERVGFRFPVTSENLLGQKHLRSFDTAPSLARLELSLQPVNTLAWNPHP